jgi:hypothetical protein
MAPPKKEETGNRYGRLLVLGEAPRKQGGLVSWRCICDCGKIRVASGIALRGGNATSCGCLRLELLRQCRRRKDERGKRYGSLVVIEEAPRKMGEPLRWRCRCDCGRYTSVCGSDLRKGSTKTCGCHRKRKPGS